MVQAGSGKNTRPYSKNNKSKKGLDAQVVACLCSKHKTQSSNLNTTKEKKAPIHRRKQNQETTYRMGENLC
jgi:hypothetical protein